jgi:branched-chain amino acid transport system substrate-binding protein
MRFARRTLMALAATTMLTSAAFAADPIKIGLTGPFTGGVMGRQIQLVERDDEGKNDVGVQVAQELINKEGVVATMGFINTGVALASQRFYQEAEIPVINNVATGTVITKQFPKDNYIFRMSANDVIQSGMIVDEAITRRGFKAPAILADSTNYGQLGREDLEKALAAKGIKPVTEEKFNIGDTDMTSQLLRVKAANADVILTYGIGPELAQIANGMGKLGWKLPIIGSWTLSMSTFIDNAGANGEGAVMPQTFIQSPSTPKRKAFIDAYQAAYKVDRIPSPISAAQGYDGTYLLAAAIAQAKSTDGPKIKAALENLTTKVEGVVTIYDKPFTATDHESITANIPVFGLVKGGRVVAAREDDIEGKNAVRLKTH